MVCKVYAGVSHLDYISDFKNQKHTVGLIVGQHLDGDYYVLRFMQSSPSRTHSSTNLLRVTDECVAEHALHTTRMLSGGLYVLGVFLVSDSCQLEPLSPELHELLSLINSSLGRDALMYGNCTNTTEKLVIHMNRKTGKCNHVGYNIGRKAVNPVEFVFEETGPVWWPLQCRFEINEVMLLSAVQAELRFKTYIKDLLVSVDNNLQSALYLFNGKIRDKDDAISAILAPSGKRKIHLNTTYVDDAETNIICVEILHETNISPPVRRTLVRESIGCIKVDGIISSNVWLQPNTKSAAASNAVQEDITRSLTARLSMHCDSLTEGERGFIADISCIHELPRRVIITPIETNVTFSDYLFPGESTNEVELTCQDVLNIGKSSVNDAEGQADLTDLFDTMETDSTESLIASTGSTNYTVYIIGASIALIVLIVSLVVQYMKT